MLTRVHISGWAVLITVSRGNHVMKGRIDKQTWGYIFVYPIFILISGLVIGVLIYNVVLSFKDMQFLGGSNQFVGFQTYKEMFERRETVTVILNSVKFNLLSTFMVILLGLIVGILLSERVRFFGVLRSFMLLPWIMPGVIVAGVWKWMLHSQSGIINRYLVGLGILDQGFPWLGTPGTALYTVSFTIVWRLFPLFALVVIAAIHSIDETLFESGRMDGMSKWQEIWNITLPSIKYQVLTMSLLNMIWITNNLVLVSIMTGGGPMYYSMTLPLFLYKLGIQFGKLSQASAATMINFFILLIWGLIYFYIYRRNQLRD